MGDEMVYLFSDKVENIVENGQNAGYRHFLLFPKVFFQKAVFIIVI